MVFWVAILVGVLFVWLAVRRGFYESLILLFNVVVSIYVAIFLAPTVARLTPAIEGAATFKVAICLLALGGGCFALLFGVSFVLLTGQFHITFPRVLDIVVAGVLGFVAGFLALSFVALAITTTPLSEHWLLSHAGFNRQAEQPNVACMAWCCDLVHSVAGVNATASPTRDAVARLLDEARREANQSNHAVVADVNGASVAQSHR
jgi:uncharacterized membrane protein required for colicin V production